MGYWDRQSKGKSSLSDKIVKPKKSGGSGRSWFETSEKKIGAIVPSNKDERKAATDESIASEPPVLESEGISLNEEIHEPLTENSDSAVKSSSDASSGFAPLPELENADDAGSVDDTSNVIDFDRHRSERLAETQEPTPSGGGPLGSGPSNGGGRSYVRSSGSNAVERAEVETAYQSILASIAPESQTMTDAALKQDHLDDEFVEGEIDLNEEEVLDAETARKEEDEQSNKPRLVTLAPAPEQDHSVEYEDQHAPAAPVVHAPVVQEQPTQHTDPALGYYHTYRADDHETQEDEDSRKAAYYLAGAASLTAICAAVYLLLPSNRTGEGVVTPEPQPDEGNETAADTAAAIPAVSLEAPTPTTEAPASTTTVETAPETVVEAPVTTAPIATPPAADAEGDLSVDLNSGELFAGAEVVTDTPAETLATPVQSITADARPPVVAVTAADPDVVMAPEATANSNVTVAAPRVKPKPDVSFAEVSNPQLVTPQLHNLPSLTSNAAIEPGTVSDLALSQIPDNRFFTTKQRQSFATAVRASFDKAQAGAVNQIQAANGASVFVTVGERSQSLQTTPVKLSSAMAPLPEAVELTPDWLITRENADLRNIPNVEADAVTAVVPAGAPIQQMGLYSAPNGDNWRLIGQEDVAVGWLHASEVMPAALAQSITQAPFETPVLASSTQDVLASVDSRTFKMGSVEDVAYRLANGQWRLPEALGSSIQSASFTTSAPIEAVTPFQGRELSQDHQTAIAGMVLTPSSKRRDVRHGRTESQEALNILFNGALAGETMSFTTTDGREGVISMADRALEERIATISRADDVEALGADLTLDSGWVRVERQARLMDRPDGDIVQGVPSMMRGTPMQQMAITQSQQGEDWALVGRDSVGFGFIRTDSVSDATGFDAANAGLTRIIPTGVAADTVSVETPCQTATYAMSGETGVMRACMTPGGKWATSIEPSTSYTTQVVN